MKNKQSVLRTDDVLSQADIMLPSQYFGTMGLSGEERLMLAVLADAINVLQRWKGSGSPCKRRNFAEAAQWVNTRGIRYPFSFDNICDALAIESQLLRARLHSLTICPANSLRRLRLPRFRLKELSRGKHMTIKQPSHRGGAPNTMNATSELPLKVDEKLAQDCTPEASVILVAFGESSRHMTGAQSVSG
jgi:hypothetical protein